MIHDPFTQALPRRTALVSAGLLFASTIVASAEAAEMSIAEQSNVKLVDDFLKGWAAPDATSAKFAEVLTDDVALRLQQNKPVIIGKAAVVSAFDGYLANGRRWDIKVLETFARGSVVANSRIDASFYPGKPGRGTPVVGVFILHDGKIKEWSDFPVKA